MSIPRRTLLLAAALLAGCQTLVAGQKRLQGRFSLRTTNSAGRSEAQQGRFELFETIGLRRLDLLTPLSGVIARIESTPSEARLYRSGDEAPACAADAETLTARLLGFPVPAAALSDFLFSPTPDQLPDASVVDGWSVRILSRFPSGAPRQMRLEKPTPAPGLAGITLTIVVDNSAAGQ